MMVQLEQQLLNELLHLDRSIEFILLFIGQFSSYQQSTSSISPATSTSTAAIEPTTRSRMF